MSDKNSYGEEPLNDGLLVLEPKTQPKTARPPLYKVVLLNDDYTPMEFVVQILKECFHKKTEEAVRIMMEVHTKGKGICGIYTRDVAETKIEVAIAYARLNEYPLQCVMEKE